LRTYYFDENQQKVILNDNIGTINYDTGIVVLNNMTFFDILNDAKQLSVHAKPETTVFQSIRNKVITMKYDDPQSIIVELTPVEA